jgi:hypothetical protein
MNCDQARNLLPELWAGALDASNQLGVREHLAACKGCCRENESLGAVWKKLGELPEEQPGEALRPRFYAMLEGYRQGLEQTAHEKGWWGNMEGWMGRWMPRRPALQFVMAALLIVAGFLAGFFVKGNGARNGELSQLRDEVRDMRQLVTVSLLKQDSASERLKGISWSNQVARPDQELLNTLLQTLDLDPSVDVRLAAVDALSRFSGDPAVRKELVRSLPRQSSPLVQISVIDLLVQWRDQQCVEVLRQLTHDEEANKTVRQRAQWGLKQLS